MNISRVFTSVLVLAAWFVSPGATPAQTVPLLSAVAGIPTGSTNVLCTTDIPTSTAVHVGDGCLPSQATLSTPSSNAIDVYGNIYISDYSHRLVRVIYQGGPVLAAMLVAANPGISNFVPIPGRIYTLAGGLQTTLAQTGSPKALYCNGLGTGTDIALATNGDNCPASEGYIQPRGMAVDAYGNLFFASVGGGEGMRVVYAGGTASTNPVYTLLKTLNTTLTSDPKAGYIYSITGSTTAGFSGDGGTVNARTAKFENVRDVVVDSYGNLFISDGNSAGSTTNSDIRVIYAGGNPTDNPVANLIKAFSPTATPTYAFIYSIVGGKSTASAACPAGGSYGGDGGSAGTALVNSPYAMFMDASSNLYFADSCNGRLRVIYQGGTLPGISSPVVGNVYTVAGGGTLTGAVSGVAATQLSIALLQSAGMDSAGNLYIADNTNRYVWQINSATGIATLYAGLGLSGTTAVVPGVGPCGGATLTNVPASVDTIGDGCPAPLSAVSPSLRFTGDNFGNVYSVDNSVLREYSFNNIFPATATGSITNQWIAFTAPPSSVAFSLQGASTTEFSGSANITCVTSASSSLGPICTNLLAFTPSQAGTRNGSVHIANGTASFTEFLTGTGIASQLSIDPGTQTKLGSGLTPQGLATDQNGNLYVADAKANQIVKINIAANTSGTLVTGLKNPNQVAIDGSGNLFVADTGNNRIAEEPVAGGAIVPLGAGLSSPQGVAVDGVGNLYIADTGNNRIVEINMSGVQSTLPLSGLLQPTRIALDTASDLFIADTGNNRVVEYSSSLGQAAVNLGSTPVTPVGVALDAAGNLYIADSSSLQVLELLAGSATVNPILSSLTAPEDIASGPNASLYIADIQATGAIALNRSLNTTTFNITNIGETSNETLSLANTGNAALTFPGSQLATGSGSATSFSITGSSANGCALGVPVAPGGNCLLNAAFTPTTPGTPTQTFAFNTNAANTSITQALLTGTGAHLTKTTTIISIMSPTTATIGFGAPVVLSTVVNLTTNVGTPTGTIKLTVDGKLPTTVSFGTGTVPLTLSNLAVGTHVVTAAFSGDLLYASSGSSISFTVVKASTTTGLTVVTSAPAGTPTVSLTAAISSLTATGETGTVSFYSGTTLLGTSNVPVGATSVTYTTTNIVFPANTFSAAYSGDANFTGSTSSVVQPAPDFALASSTSALATTQGGVAQAIITVTPTFNLLGVISPSCSNLPNYTVCRFQPTSVTINGNAAVGVQLQVFTDIPDSVAHLQPHRSNRIMAATFGPWGLGLLALCGCAWRKKLRVAQVGLVIMAAVIAVGGLTGCLAQIVAPETPAGTQNITVSFTSSASATPVTHSLTYSMTVNTP